MAFSGMLRHVALRRTDVSVEHSASIVRVTRIGELRILTVTSNRRKLRRNTCTANAVVSSLILFTLMMAAIISSETSFVTRATKHQTAEDGFLNSLTDLEKHQF
jgi:hypothetical protein